jgi:hypothetical protein
VSRWTLRRLPKKPQHAPHERKDNGVLIKFTWRSARVEFGKMFTRNGQSVVRIHNRNVIYPAWFLREHGNIETR